MRGSCAFMVGVVSLCGAAAGCGFHTEGLELALSAADDGGSAGTGAPRPLPTGGTGGTVPVGGTGGSGMMAGGTGGVVADGGSAGTGGYGVPPDAGQPSPPPDAMPGRRLDASRPDAAQIDTTPPGTIECGAVQCNVDSEICCAGALGAPACAPSTEIVCPAASARRCDGPEDCADDKTVCCAQPAVIGGFRSACLKPSDCTNLAGAAICHDGADCLNSGESCGVTDFSASTKTCQRDL